MKAFITGANGFLGLNIIDALLKDKWDITAMVRPTSNIKYLTEKNVKIVRGNLNDEASLLEIIPDEVDAIFHVAANVTMWKPRFQEQYRDNVIGTQNIVSAALKRRAGRLIHTTSISAYGHLNGHVTEETKSDAAGYANFYFRTKYLAEQEVHKGIEKGLDAVILNPANIIGTYDYHNWGRVFLMVENQALPGISSGTLTHSHAGEVAKAHVSAFKKGRKGENYLLGCVDITLLELVQGIGKILGRKTPKKPLPNSLFRAVGYLYDFMGLITRKEPEVTSHIAQLLTSRHTCSSEKAIKELGYTQRTLEEMLQDNYVWLVKEGFLKKE